MREGIYRSATLLAWPAAAWFALESAIRSATGDSQGAAIAFGWLLMASGVLAAARLRRASLHS